jgi:N-acetyl-gamma-glutamyl-phosphate reductase
MEGLVMVNISIIGCTGYAGEELLRLAFNHKQICIKHLFSKTFAGKKLSQVYKSYFGKNDMVLQELDIEAMKEDSDVVFSCLPHGASASIISEIAKHDIKVIDLSGDFRYDDTRVYEAWYNTVHTNQGLNDQFVYGLSELYADKIAKANYVANTGCYTTCSILPLYPLLKAKAINTKGIIIDAKSGVSGAGRKESLPLSFCEQAANFKAYGVANHRHTSEIEQEVSKAAEQKIELSFTPHLLPVKRGILATIYCDLNDGVEKADIKKAYAKYDDCDFIHVMEDGLPELKHVVGSNNVIIGYQIDKRLNRLIIVSVLDNLIKGAAGQAIQNMNLMFGLDQTMGLNPIGWYL